MSASRFNVARPSTIAAEAVAPQGRFGEALGMLPDGHQCITAAIARVAGCGSVRGDVWDIGAGT